MDIQIFSDFHGEAYQDQKYIWKYVTPMAPVAVVAGDIDARNFEQTVNEIATKFEHVIVLFGNHEFYKKKISWRPDMSLVSPNVHVLDQGVFELEDVIFIGATLWTDFKNNDWHTMHAAKDKINDFHVIRDETGGNKFTPHMASDLHRKDKAYLKMMIEKYRGQKVVMVTHFLPSYQLVHEKWRGLGTDMLNYYFAASCDDLIETSEAKAWVFGHTHDERDMEICGTRFVCNPIGYPRENPFYTDKVITV